jgi:hypothetical protein
VARFIDAYNHRRQHSSCEMLPPVAYEQLLAERAAEAARQDHAAQSCRAVRWFDRRDLLVRNW